MHAYFDPPIREAALVTINGQPPAALWHPPYRLDVTKLLKPGQNHIEIHVYNTALNAWSALPPHDYKPLIEKYGDRFPDAGPRQSRAGLLRTSRPGRSADPAVKMSPGFISPEFLTNPKGRFNRSRLSWTRTRSRNRAVSAEPFRKASEFEHSFSFVNMKPGPPMYSAPHAPWPEPSGNP